VIGLAKNLLAGLVLAFLSFSLGAGVVTVLAAAFGP
jgi:hypothetical protein